MAVRITSYTDADFAYKEDRKSVSAVVTYVKGIMIGWNSKKQASVALSTAEAELVAAAVGGREKELFGEVDLRTKAPTVSKIDNQAIIKQLENEASAAKAKHVAVKLNLLKDYTKKGKVHPEHVASQDMVADLLTKTLDGPRMDDFQNKIGFK